MKITNEVKVLIYCIKCGKANIDTANFCYGCGERIHKGVEANRGGRPSGSAAVTIQPSGNIGKVCPFCQTPFKNEAEIILCPECRMPHHIECWQENNGQCTIFGCKGQGVIRSNITPPVNVPLRGARQNQAITGNSEGRLTLGGSLIALSFFIIFIGAITGLLVTKWEFYSQIIGIGMIFMLVGGILKIANSK